MSADRIRVRNASVNAHRTNEDRRRYRETYRRLSRAVTEAKTDEEFYAALRARREGMQAIK